MEREEAEKEDIEVERLAEIRAKNRLDSWSERFKSWWLDLPWILAAFGVGWWAASWNLDIGVEILVALIIIGPLVWFFHHRQKSWKQQRLREFYEEELLQLKLKK